MLSPSGVVLTDLRVYIQFQTRSSVGCCAVANAAAILCGNREWMDNTRWRPYLPRHSNQRMVYSFFQSIPERHQIGSYGRGWWRRLTLSSIQPTIFRCDCIRHSCRKVIRVPSIDSRKPNTNDNTRGRWYAGWADIEQQSGVVLM